MAEWQVVLRGDPSHLEYLARRLSAPPVSVRLEDGVYVLRSNALTDSFGDTQVFEYARELVQRMKGAAKLGLRDIDSVSVASVVRGHGDGSRHVSLSVQAFAVLSSESEPAVPDLTTCISLSETDAKVANALRYFTSGRMPDLYKVLEVVEADVGRPSVIVAKGWADSAQLNRFKLSVNNPDAVGDEARHGRPLQHEKPPANPMSRQEAESLLRSILARWIESKRRS